MQYMDSSTTNLEGLQPLIDDFCLTTSLCVVFSYYVILFGKKLWEIFLNMCFTTVSVTAVWYCLVLDYTGLKQYVAFVEPVDRKYCKNLHINVKMSLYGSLLSMVYLCVWLWQ